MYATEANSCASTIQDSTRLRMSKKYVKKIEFLVSYMNISCFVTTIFSTDIFQKNYRAFWSVRGYVNLEFLVEYWLKWDKIRFISNTSVITHVCPQSGENIFEAELFHVVLPIHGAGSRSVDQTTEIKVYYNQTKKIQISQSTQNYKVLNYLSNTKYSSPIPNNVFRLLTNLGTIFQTDI